MAVKYKMDEEARDTLDRRYQTGSDCIAPADSGGGEETETAARDAVSDILTRLFGPAGYCVYGSELTPEQRKFSIVLDHERGELARTFLDMALESWEGDAEDYTATLVTVDNPLLPEPGEYGYEEPHEDKLNALESRIRESLEGFDAPEDDEELQDWLDNLDSEAYGRYMALTELLDTAEDITVDNPLLP